MKPASRGQDSNIRQNKIGPTTEMVLDSQSYTQFLSLLGKTTEVREEDDNQRKLEEVHESETDGLQHSSQMQEPLGAMTLSAEDEAQELASLTEVRRHLERASGGRDVASFLLEYAVVATHGNIDRFDGNIAEEFDDCGPSISVEALRQLLSEQAGYMLKESAQVNLEDLLLAASDGRESRGSLSEIPLKDLLGILKLENDTGPPVSRSTARVAESGPKREDSVEEASDEKRLPQEEEKKEEHAIPEGMGRELQKLRPITPRSWVAVDGAWLPASTP